MRAWEGFDPEAMAERAFGKSSQSCPCCQGTTWDTGGVGVHVQHFRDGSLPLGEGYQALALLCLTCGFMRLHALDVLRAQTDPKMN